MKKILLILFLSMPFFSQAFGLKYNPVYHSKNNRVNNTAPKGFDRNKIVVGGTLGFSLLQNGGYYAISPSVGYQIHKNLVVGTGINYSWQGQTTTYGGYPLKIRAHDIGWSVFARPIIAHMIILDVEPELNFMTEKYKFTGGYQDATYRNNSTSLLIGGGYYRPFGEFSGSYLMILFDILQDAKSPYANNSFVNLRAGMMMSNLWGGR